MFPAAESILRRSSDPVVSPADDEQERIPRKRGRTVLIFLGLISLLLAVVDLICGLFGLSLTAVSWSPLLFGALGFMFICLEGFERGSAPARSYQTD
jgi:hypothetical protein